MGHNRPAMWQSAVPQTVLSLVLSVTYNTLNLAASHTVPHNAIKYQDQTFAEISTLEYKL